MNVKKAKKLRKMISHLNDERTLKYINSSRKIRYVLQQDNKIRKEEFPTKSAVANIKRHIYQTMKKHYNEPEILNALIKGLKTALEDQAKAEKQANSQEVGDE